MKKNISKSERVIMEILWDKEPLTAAQVVEQAQLSQPWSDKTIKTFLHRLREKGMITARKDGVFYYSTTLTQEQADVGMAKSIIESAFEGSIKKMMTHFVHNGDLSNEDIDDLKDYLETLKKENG